MKMLTVLAITLCTAYVRSEDLAPNYQFQYRVKDDYSGQDFGQEESRAGYNTEGEYEVQLPDGRRQIVRYTVKDPSSGYIADVQYQGEATYVDAAPLPSYPPAPSPSLPIRAKPTIVAKPAYAARPAPAVKKNIRQYKKIPAAELPSLTPTYAPARAPTYSPARASTYAPARAPTYAPARAPTYAPARAPSYAPARKSTYSPARTPTYSPARAPTYAPARTSTYSPARTPTYTPTYRPTPAPTASRYRPSPAPSSPASPAPTPAVYIPSRKPKTAKYKDILHTSESKMLYSLFRGDIKGKMTPPAKHSDDEKKEEKN